MCTTKICLNTHTHTHINIKVVLVVFNNNIYTLRFVKVVRSGVDVLDKIEMLLAYIDNAFSMFRYDTTVFVRVCRVWCMQTSTVTWSMFRIIYVRLMVAIVVLAIAVIPMATI